MTKCETAICQLVEIMLEQLKLMFSIRDEVTQQRTVKLQRLDNRISQSLIHPKP